MINRPQIDLYSIPARICLGIAIAGLLVALLITIVYFMRPAILGA